jgi:hypothetical protein
MVYLITTEVTFIYGPLRAPLSSEVFTSDGLLRCCAILSCRRLSVFQRDVLSPPSGSNIKPVKQKAGYLPAVCLAHHNPDDEVHLPETSVNFYEATWHSTAGDTILHYVNCFSFLINYVSRDCFGEALSKETLVYLVSERILLKLYLGVP